MPHKGEDETVQVSTGAPFVIGLVMLAGVLAVPLGLLWFIGSDDESAETAPVPVVSVSVPPSVPGCAMFCGEDEMEHAAAAVVVPGCTMFCRESEVAR
ncbi:hypothetical protein [Nocardia cyriacigeorgica]|uniref:hypothetical protein n=1 Tax=Nocardia cyriacigeorgica TaxID=135487 RepID=UPI002454FD37|nr:hypothetical protein [Nocardia cyriacigeorgica]